MLITAVLAPTTRKPSCAHPTKSVTYGVTTNGSNKDMSYHKSKKQRSVITARVFFGFILPHALARITKLVCAFTGKNVGKRYMIGVLFGSLAGPF